MDENNRVTPRECRGAKEYAKRRLRESDEPMSPQELADEYDCSGSHMRSRISELKGSGEIERVTYGYYDATDEDSSESNSDDDNRQQTLETMPTQDEYNRQYQEQTDGSTDDSTDDITVTPTDTTDRESTLDNAETESESVTSVPLPMHPKQLLAVFVVALGLYLLYQTLDSGNETPTSGESEPESENTTEETTGGLVQ